MSLLGKAVLRLGPSKTSACDKEWQSPLSQLVSSHCPAASITSKQYSCNVDTLLYLPLFCHHLDWLSLVKEFVTGDTQLLKKFLFPLL